MAHKLTWVLIAFLFGIAAHSLWPFTPIPPMWLTLGIGSIILFCWISYCQTRVFKRFFFVLVLLLAACVGIWRFDLSIPVQEEGMLQFSGVASEFSGYVHSVDQDGKRATINIAVHEANGIEIDRWTGSANILIQTATEGVREGSVVSWSCKPRVPGSAAQNLIRRRYLARQGIWLECPGTVPLEVIAPPSRWDVIAALSAGRHALTDRIHRIFPPEEAELVAGMLYGDQNLAETLKTDVQRAGLMHLVAVSGSNVTIVIMVIAAVVLALGCTRRQSFMVTTVGLLAFVIFVGASASVLRAGFMGWMLLLARELGRKGWPDRLLLVTAVIVSLMNPWLLCFDAGFALSFLAMWGLLVWTPVFERLLAFLPSFLGIRASATTTLGATLMTVPYLGWTFGRMTLAGLITNILAAPLVPWTMFWGAIGVAVPQLALPAQGLVRGVMYIAQSSRFMSWLDLQIEGMDIWLMFACYFLLWRWWRMLSQKDGVDTDVGNKRLSVTHDSAEEKVLPTGWMYH